MASEVKPTYIPLWCYLAAVITVIALSLLSHPFMYYIVDIDKKKILAERLNLKRLEHPEALESIVVLGSSLSRAAFQFDGAMDKSLTPIGVNNKFIRITLSNARRNSLEPILPLIAEVKPRLVFIELEMLQRILIRKKTRRYYDLLFNDLFKSIKWLTFSLLKIDNLSDANNGFIPKCNNEIRVQRKSEDIDKLLQAKFRIYKQRFSSTWLSFFAAVQRQGGQVILVEMGRSEFATQGLSKTFKLDFAQVKKDILANEKIAIWQYPGPFSQTNYCDLAHLNHKGAALFNLWFINKLATFTGSEND